MEIRDRTHARKALNNLTANHPRSALFAALKDPQSEQADRLPTHDKQTLQAVGNILSNSELARKLSGDVDRAGEIGDRQTPDDLHDGSTAQTSDAVVRPINNPDTNVAVQLPYRLDEQRRSTRQPRVMLSELYNDLRRDAEYLLELGEPFEYAVNRSDSLDDPVVFILYLSTGDNSPSFNQLRSLLDAVQRQAFGAELWQDEIKITTKSEIQRVVQPSSATTEFQTLRKSSSWPPAGRR